MSRYRFAVRPWWIVSHLFVLALVVAMLTAGFWQLRRLDERRTVNDAVIERSRQAEVPIESLVGLDDTEVDELEYRRVTATGTYLADEEVLVGAPTRDGVPGSWVFTPLQLDSGGGVAVNRGWISNNGELDAVPDTVTAPDGTVTVTGIVRLTETRSGLGASDAAQGRLSYLSRLDVQRLDQQLELDLLPVQVTLQGQDPAVAADAPRPAQPHVLDEGPHLSYAVQWFIFTTVAVVGYPLILRRKANDDRRGGRSAPDWPPDDPDQGSDPGAGAESPTDQVSGSSTSRMTSTAHGA